MTPTMGSEELVNRLLDILFWADPKAVRRWFDLHERDFGIRKPR